MYTLHKPVKRKICRRKTIVFGQNEFYQADLVDLKYLSCLITRFKYILSVIDMFSKYGFMVVLEDKKSKTLIKAYFF